MPLRVLGLPSSILSIRAFLKFFLKAKCMYDNLKESMTYLLYVEISSAGIGQTPKISGNYRPRYVT